MILLFAAEARQSSTQCAYATQELHNEEKRLSYSCASQGWHNIPINMIRDQPFCWLGYQSTQLNIANLLSMSACMSGYASIYRLFYGSPQTLAALSLACFLGAFYLFRPTNHALLIDHGNKVLEIFNNHAQAEGCKFNYFTEIKYLPSHIKIFGFSLFPSFQNRERFEKCAQRGIVLIATGNDGMNIQEMESPYLELAQKWKRVILISSNDTRANYLTSEQVKNLGISYIEAPFSFSLSTDEVVEGTSFGQSYVGALLDQCMRKVPNLSLEHYVDALMHASQTKKLSKNSTEDTINAMIKLLEQP